MGARVTDLLPSIGRDGCKNPASDLGPGSKLEVQVFVGQSSKPGTNVFSPTFFVFFCRMRGSTLIRVVGEEKLQING